MKKEETRKLAPSAEARKEYVEPRMSVFECKGQTLLYDGSCPGNDAVCIDD